MLVTAMIHAQLRQLKQLLHVLSRLDPCLSGKSSPHPYVAGNLQLQRIHNLYNPGRHCPGFEGPLVIFHQVMSET